MTLREYTKISLEVNAVMKNSDKTCDLKYPERIRNLRQDNDLTQKEIADMLKIAQTTYSQYELYKRPMPIECLVSLCRFYNVSADYILGLSDKK